MRIGNIVFARVSVLVLDYDPHNTGDSSKAVITAYNNLTRLLRNKYPSPSQNGVDTTVLANRTLIKLHQPAFEQGGLHFFPDWDNSEEYGALLREGLRQGAEVHMMVNIGNKRKPEQERTFGSWFSPIYLLERVMPAEFDSRLDIRNLEGKVDVVPARPLYRV